MAAAAAAAALAALAWRQLAPTAVLVVAPTRATAVDAIYATGSVEPTVMLPIAPRVAGTLAALAADEGSRVRKGEVLARLEDTDLTSTVDELTARARYAREQFERTEDLVRQGFVSPTELDRTRSEMDAADATLRRARSQREFTALRAPADGMIIRRDGEIGQYLAAGQALFTMSCCAPLRVSVDVDEEDIVRVHVGQKVVLRADALPGRVLDGTVAQVTPKGDPVARSYRVRIRLADATQLQVGMTVDANLVVAERPQALLVPSAAVQGGAVWVVCDGRLHRQPVRTGVLGTERTEIREGLEPDAHVVLTQADALVEGHRATEHAAGASALPGAAEAAAPASGGAGPGATGH
jgi:RND family efflux transporter MFP subunit